MSRIAQLAETRMSALDARIWATVRLIQEEEDPSIRVALEQEVERFQAELDLVRDMWAEAVHQEAQA